MQNFRELLAGMGCEDVATYIQSGNAVLRYSSNAKTLSAEMSTTIEAEFGFRPHVLVLKGSDFLKIAAANPYAAVAVEPKHVHILFYLDAVAHGNTAAIDELACNGEEYTLTDSAFFLHAPNGIGRSKLAQKIEKILDVQATGRNWRTVGKVCDMLSKLDSASD